MPRRNAAWNKMMEDYLSFSRSQRRALGLMMVLTIGFTFFIRWNFSVTGADELKEPFVQAEIEALLSTRDSSSFLPTGRFQSEQGFTAFRGADAADSYYPGQLFYFDPNTASLDQLKALGIREKTAQNLINYREKGGQFRKPEDLAKLYTLKPEEAKRLIPFVRIVEKDVVKSIPEPAAGEIPPVWKEFPKNEREEIGPIDVNLADSVLWQMLPGIGAKRASAIMRYRERLGGFITIDQVGETTALPDSVFEQLIPKLQIGQGPIKRLSLNTASEAELKNHPYIGWQWAKIIVAYRTQHGAYNQVDDLLKIHVMKRDWLDKVRPYLSVEH